MKTSACTNYDEVVLADGPVAYFIHDGGAIVDRAPAGHVASIRGGPETTTLPNSDAATVFDGKSDYVEVADAPDLSVPTTGALTIEAWIRPDVLEFPKDEKSGFRRIKGYKQMPQLVAALKRHAHPGTERIGAAA